MIRPANIEKSMQLVLIKSKQLTVDLLCYKATTPVSGAPRYKDQKTLNSCKCGSKYIKILSNISTENK